jgi:hypothetical protein
MQCFVFEISQKDPLTTAAIATIFSAFDDKPANRSDNPDTAPKAKCLAGV